MITVLHERSLEKKSFNSVIQFLKDFLTPFEPSKTQNSQHYIVGENGFYQMAQQGLCATRGVGG